MGLFTPGWVKKEMADLAEFRADPRYDPEMMRVVLPPEQLDQMPVKMIDRAELIELECKWRYNPVCDYRDTVETFPNEVGHDEARRYVLLDGPKEELPVRHVTHTELAAAMCKATYQPLVTPVDGEVGRDEAYQYVLID